MTKLTEADIVSRIIETRYIQDGTLTICVCRLQNGFRVVGASACVDPAQYDPQVGERLALEDAKDQIWQLEGYLLLEQMWKESQP